MQQSIIKPFLGPLYVTSPVMPDLKEVKIKLEEIWTTKWLTNNGPQSQILERRLMDTLRVPYLSLFNNGTSALMTGCKVLGLTGEVITTPFTFPATPHALTWNNINPIFCDIDPTTMNIDADKIESMITSRTTGILAVHLFGIPCDVVKIQNIADRYGLKVLYDAAHAFGVVIDNQGIGNYGDLSMISFHATKLFHTVEGGALICKNKNQKEIIDLFRNFGIRNEDEVVIPGINSKMNEIQSVIGLLVLDLLEGEMRKRRELTDIYRHRLKNVEGISFQEDMSGITYNYSIFAIKIDEGLFCRSRDYVYNQFKKYNVYTRKYYSQLCSEYPHYQTLPSADNSNIPVATRIAKQVLTLPLYGGLSVDDVEKICDILIEIRK